MAELHGEIIIVMTAAKSGWVLKDHRIDTLAGKEFLIGTMYYPDRSHDFSWAHGHSCWISIEQVTAIYEYRDAESYLESLRLRKASRGGSRFSRWIRRR